MTRVESRGWSRRPSIERGMVTSSQDFLGKAIKEGHPLSAGDLYGLLLAMHAVRVRRTPDGAYIPDTFTFPGSQGPVAVSHQRDFETGKIAYGVEFSSSGKTVSLEASVVDGVNNSFLVSKLNPDTGELVSIGSNVPGELQEDLRRELKTSLNYLYKPSRGQNRHRRR